MLKLVAAAFTKATDHDCNYTRAISKAISVPRHFFLHRVNTFHRAEKDA